MFEFSICMSMPAASLICTYIEKQAFIKGHLISEQIIEDIDFPKLQRKYC